MCQPHVHFAPGLHTHRFPHRKDDTMTPNIGNLDRWLRTAIGVLLIALAATGTIGGWGWLGVVALATALFRFCPLYTLLGVSSSKR